MNLSIIKFVFLFLWQLPQNLIGLILLYFYKPKKTDKKYVYIWSVKNTAASFGQFIFLTENTSNFILKHEQGHQKQSILLGWLMIPFITIPSIIWSKIYKKFSKSYYWFYTEAWANKLSKI